MNVNHIPSTCQTVDILTEPLSKANFLRFRERPKVKSLNENLQAMQQVNSKDSNFNDDSKIISQNCSESQASMAIHKLYNRWTAKALTFKWVSSHRLKTPEVKGLPIDSFSNCCLKGTIDQRSLSCIEFSPNLIEFLRLMRIWGISHQTLAGLGFEEAY